VLLLPVLLAGGGPRGAEEPAGTEP
jgi:hypothetical protein